MAIREVIPTRSRTSSGVAEYSPAVQFMCSTLLSSFPFQLFRPNGICPRLPCPGHGFASMAGRFGPIRPVRRLPREERWMYGAPRTTLRPDRPPAPPLPGGDPRRRTAHSRHGGPGAALHAPTGPGDVQYGHGPLPPCAGQGRAAAAPARRARPALPAPRAAERPAHAAPRLRPGAARSARGLPVDRGGALLRRLRQRVRAVDRGEHRGRGGRVRDGPGGRRVRIPRDLALHRGGPRHPGRQGARPGAGRAPGAPRTRPGVPGLGGLPPAQRGRQTVGRADRPGRPPQGPGGGGGRAAGAEGGERGRGEGGGGGAGAEAVRGCPCC